MHIRYVVEKIDIDGDGVPDGDLIKQFDGDRLIQQKFVPAERVKELVNSAIHMDQGMTHKEKVIYSRMPHQGDIDKPVIIQDQTKFSQHLKAGIGMGVGTAVGQGVVGAMFSVLGSVFSDGGGAKRRRQHRTKK